MNSLKIAVIGGGGSYTPELVEGLIQRIEELPVTELALVDVEPGREKVEIIDALTRQALSPKRFPATPKRKSSACATCRSACTT